MNAERHRLLAGISPLLLATLSSCVSHQYRPDTTTLPDSPDCASVNGRFLAASDEDGRSIGKLLLDTDDTVSDIEVTKTEMSLTVHTSISTGRTPMTRTFNRITCADSVLRAILIDEHDSNGLILSASDRVLELFVSDDDTLNLRFIDTTLSFVFIVPYYRSRDALISLQRAPTDW